MLAPVDRMGLGTLPNLHGSFKTEAINNRMVWEVYDKANETVLS